MKKLFILLIIIFALCNSFSTSFIVLAETSSENFACVGTENVYLYSSKNEKDGLFIIPQTYYVKIIEKGDDFCLVQYLIESSSTKAITGYCKTSELIFVDFTPSRPFLYYSYYLTYYLDGYQNTTPQNNNLSTYKVKCHYYGDYVIGSTTYHYVLVNGEFGYVPQTVTINYEKNTDYLKSSSNEKNNPTSENNPINSSNVLYISLVFGLCAVAVAVVYFIFKPSKKEKSNFSIEEEELSI